MGRPATRDPLKPQRIAFAQFLDTLMKTGQRADGTNRPWGDEELGRHVGMTREAVRRKHMEIGRAHV